MKDTLQTSEVSLGGNGSENSGFATQLQTIFQYLQKNVATASMVSKATGVPQKNICRYKRDLEKAVRLWETEKKLCAVTGFKAWYITTNPDKAPKHLVNQLTLTL
jgi:hypothetical protein